MFSLCFCFQILSALLGFLVRAVSGSPSPLSLSSSKTLLQDFFLNSTPLRAEHISLEEYSFLFSFFFGGRSSLPSVQAPSSCKPRTNVSPVGPPRRQVVCVFGVGSPLRRQGLVLFRVLSALLLPPSRGTNPLPPYGDQMRFFLLSYSPRSSPEVRGLSLVTFSFFIIPPFVFYTRVPSTSWMISLTLAQSFFTGRSRLCTPSRARLLFRPLYFRLRPIRIPSPKKPFLRGFPPL